MIPDPFEFAEDSLDIRPASFPTCRMVRPRTDSGNEVAKKRYRAILMSEKGPGPAAYLLKGTMGQKQHCPSKKQGPAYSFGSRTKGFYSYTGNTVR